MVDRFPQPAEDAEADYADLAFVPRDYSPVPQPDYEQPIPGSAVMPDFAVRMQSRFARSTRSALDEPTTRLVSGTLQVERTGEILTIAGIAFNGSPVERIYAQRTLEVEGASVFMILPALPEGYDDDQFFPALGTVVVHEVDRPRRLKAAGADVVTGEYRGWTFTAVEEL
jgi:hypothetical protein